MRRVQNTALVTIRQFNTRQVSQQAPILHPRYSSTQTTNPPSGQETENNESKNQDDLKEIASAAPRSSENQSALSRRLAEFTEEALNENPRFMKAAVASGEFDFNPELKQQLQERIASADFKSTNAQAFATANLPVRLIAPEYPDVFPQLTRWTYRPLSGRELET